MMSSSGNFGFLFLLFDCERLTYSFLFFMGCCCCCKRGSFPFEDRNWAAAAFVIIIRTRHLTTTKCLRKKSPNIKRRGDWVNVQEIGDFQPKICPKEWLQLGWNFLIDSGRDWNERILFCPLFRAFWVFLGDAWSDVCACLQLLLLTFYSPIFDAPCHGSYSQC